MSRFSLARYERSLVWGVTRRCPCGWNLPARVLGTTVPPRAGTAFGAPLGLWGGIGAAGATVGLIAGGLLTRYAGWEYIFFLNVPIGVAALLLAPRLVPESRLAGVRRRFDPLGAVTMTGAPLLLLVYAISKAPQAGWGSARTVTLLAVSAALLVAFLAVDASGRGIRPAAVRPSAGR